MYWAFFFCTGVRALRRSRLRRPTGHGQGRGVLALCARPGLVGVEQGLDVLLVFLLHFQPGVEHAVHYLGELGKRRIVRCRLLRAGGARLRIFGDPLQAIFASGSKSNKAMAAALDRWEGLKAASAFDGTSR